MTNFIGRSPDGLTLQERLEIAGKWIAMELYSPSTLPLRKIEAVAASAQECASAIRQRGLDPTQFEYLTMGSPF